MNNSEARKILDEHLRQWEQRGYDELARLAAVTHIETPEQTGNSGTRYYMEIQFFWDSSPGGAVRVFGSIDDGGIRAYSPLSRCGLVYPESA